MKKPLILTVFLGIITILNAQIPNGFSYQAVVRNSEQMLLKNQEVTIKATILRNDEAIFEQTQTATTNENGLLTIVIGNESFQEIDWLQGTLFIKTQIDPAGSSNFTIETQTQLLTVPYSIAAKTAEKAVDALGLGTLIEKINILEAQVEELWTYIFPIEIPFEEYSLEGTTCQWKNANTWITKELIIINNNEDLEQYIECPNYDYNEIDFSKYTLLLSRGWACDWVHGYSCNSFQKFSECCYVKKVEVCLYPLTIMRPWQVPIIVKKLSEEIDIELVATYFYQFDK